MSTSPPANVRDPAGDDPTRMAKRAALWGVALLALLALALPAVGIDEVGAHLARLSLALVAALLALSLANYALRGLRWHLLSRAAGLRVPPLRNGLYYVAGFAFAVTPGKLGEVVRLWLLRRHHGAPYERTAGVLLLDRVTDALPLVSLCLPGAAGFAAGQAWGVAGLAAFLFAVLALAARPGALAALVKFAYGTVRRRPRLFAAALRSLRSLRALTRPSVLAMAFGLGLAGWSAEVLATWLVLDGLGADVSLAAAAFVFAFGMLVGGLPIFPGGVGGAEATMVACLLLLGVDTGTAVTATAVIRLTTLGFALALGFAALPLAVRRERSPASTPAGVVRGGAGQTTG